MIKVIPIKKGNVWEWECPYCKSNDLTYIWVGGGREQKFIQSWDKEYCGYCMRNYLIGFSSPVKTLAERFKPFQEIITEKYVTKV